MFYSLTTVNKLGYETLDDFVEEFINQYKDSKSIFVKWETNGVFLDYDYDSTVCVPNIGNCNIFVVCGYINESGDTDTWIEELFDDEEQAKACCEFLNLTKSQDNVEFSWHEMYISTEDYISKLRYLNT